MKVCDVTIHFFFKIGVVLHENWLQLYSYTVISLDMQDVGEVYQDSAMNTKFLAEHHAEPDLA